MSHRSSLTPVIRKLRGEKLENYESELRFVAHQKVPQIVADIREKFQIDAFKNGWAGRPAIYIFVPMHFLVTALRAEQKKSDQD